MGLGNPLITVHEATERSEAIRAGAAERQAQFLKRREEYLAGPDDSDYQG